ncbi:hypothetical protein G6F66_015253 [Rhizopus arrhizus]|nr:hypothetical protein G6F66_015253 [Rhizopus arrhizus]
MLTGTFLAIFFVPAFFVIMLRMFKVKRMSEHRDKHDTSANGPQEVSAEGQPRTGGNAPGLARVLQRPGVAGLD